MSASAVTHKPSQLLEEILAFVDHSQGLNSSVDELGTVSIHQAVDGRVLSFSLDSLNEVLQRVDADGKHFLQVNFANNSKILLTETLVGFKPLEIRGLDMSRIPKVVTTPDLMSVFEAIEETLASSDEQAESESEILKKVFLAILQGGEAAGFSLSKEKLWLRRLTTSRGQASA